MTTDDRPSIAELQRQLTDHTGPLPLEKLEWWSPHDRAVIDLRNAAPVLLEIAATAVAWQDDPHELLNHRALVAALAKVQP